MIIDLSSAQNITEVRQCFEQQLPLLFNASQNLQFSQESLQCLQENRRFVIEAWPRFAASQRELLFQFKQKTCENRFVDVLVEYDHQRHILNPTEEDIDSAIAKLSTCDAVAIQLHRCQTEIECGLFVAGNNEGWTAYDAKGTWQLQFKGETHDREELICVWPSLDLEVPRSQITHDISVVKKIAQQYFHEASFISE